MGFFSSIGNAVSSAFNSTIGQAAAYVYGAPVVAAVGAVKSAGSVVGAVKSGKVGDAAKAYTGLQVNTALNTGTVEEVRQKAMDNISGAYGEQALGKLGVSASDIPVIGAAIQSRQNVDANLQNIADGKFTKADLQNLLKSSADAASAGAALFTGGLGNFSVESLLPSSDSLTDSLKDAFGNLFVPKSSGGNGVANFPSSTTGDGVVQTSKLPAVLAVVAIVGAVYLVKRKIKK